MTRLSLGQVLATTKLAYERNNGIITGQSADERALLAAALQSMGLDGSGGAPPTGGAPGMGGVPPMEAASAGFWGTPGLKRNLAAGALGLGALGAGYGTYKMLSNKKKKKEDSERD